MDEPFTSQHTSLEPLGAPQYVTLFMPPGVHGLALLGNNERGGVTLFMPPGVQGLALLGNNERGGGDGRLGVSMRDSSDPSFRVLRVSLTISSMRRVAETATFCISSSADATMAATLPLCAMVHTILNAINKQSDKYKYNLNHTFTLCVAFHIHD